MKTPPFFRLSPPDADLPVKPIRYPYHDTDECPLGRAVKRNGQWQPYEPTQINETRTRCAICIEMSNAASS